jgi:hypothetical protein
MSFIHTPTQPEIFYLYPKNKAFGEGKRIYPDSEREIYWNLNLLIGQPISSGKGSFFHHLALIYAVVLSGVCGFVVLGLLVDEYIQEQTINFVLLFFMLICFVPLPIWMRRAYRARKRFRELITEGQLVFGQVIGVKDGVIGEGTLDIHPVREISYEFESPSSGTIQTRHATRQSEHLPMAGAQVYVLYANDKLYTLL